MPPPSPPSCLYCGCDQFGSPSEPVGIGAFVICGNCCALHVVDAEVVSVEGGATWGEPYLRKLTRLERHEASQDAGVKAFLDAYQLVQMEQRIGAGAEKRKPAGAGQRVRSGDIVRLEAKGPDAR